MKHADKALTGADGRADAPTALPAPPDERKNKINRRAGEGGQRFEIGETSRKKHARNGQQREQCRRASSARFSFSRWPRSKPFDFSNEDEKKNVPKHKRK